MASKLTVVARIRAKAGKEDHVRRELQKLLSPTRSEQGCLNYDLHESVDIPGEFLFHENWSSKEALDRHLGTPHLKSFLGQTDQILAEPIEISLWNKIE